VLCVCAYAASDQAGCWVRQAAERRTMPDPVGCPTKIDIGVRLAGFDLTRLTDSVVVGSVSNGYGARDDELRVERDGRAMREREREKKQENDRSRE
jgi:hypothetical protein